MTTFYLLTGIGGTAMTFESPVKARFAFDKRKQNVYIRVVVRSFADTETQRFYTTGKSRRYPPAIRTWAAMRLLQLDAATRLDDLRLPPSNRLEPMKGDRRGQWRK